MKEPKKGYYVPELRSVFEAAFEGGTPQCPYCGAKATMRYLDGITRKEATPPLVKGRPVDSPVWWEWLKIRRVFMSPDCPNCGDLITKAMEYGKGA